MPVAGMVAVAIDIAIGGAPSGDGEERPVFAPELIVRRSSGPVPA